jgi:hypothetical protein
MPENRQTLAATPKASLEEESALRCGPGSGNYSDGTIIRYNQFTVNASSSGQFVITFNSVVNNSLISGIEN